ncbi:PREDICTED: general mRNAion factor 3C [Prunus dulcis]|uniref:PREDICTED: general mRNAion factor 3C n=1 Tax=Prunus dulcis TaxID=3755 RepID=A0A5E4FK93_PRUDU|nr:PREDICTED: general mRNAion factor 3C [Prunus dulcis]
MCSVAEELRSLGAQIAYNTPDPEHGVDCVKYIAHQHLYSNAAWNCYYKVITRLDDWYARHYKFLRGKRDKLKDTASPTKRLFFNIARACHHVGLVTLAAWHYDKVLAMHVKDYPIPKLPHEKPESVENRLPGYCDLRREAAFNLHLIYKKSGAVDLARQVLRDHCTF